MTGAPGAGPAAIARYVAGSVAGAVYLIVDRQAALARFDLSIAGFWRSFGAALLVLPVYGLALAAVGRSLGSTGIAGALMIYGLNWVAFPIVMLAVVKLLDLGEHYVRYIIVYNWARVIIAAVQLPLRLVVANGVLGDAAFVVIATVVTAAVQVYQWRIARIALQAGWGAAVGIVVLDLVLGDLIAAAGLALLGSELPAAPGLSQ